MDERGRLGDNAFDVTVLSRGLAWLAGAAVTGAQHKALQAVKADEEEVHAKESDGR